MQAAGGDDGVAADDGGVAGAADGAPGGQRAGLLRALPGYLLPPHLSGSLMLVVVLHHTCIYIYISSQPSLVQDFIIDLATHFVRLDGGALFIS